MNHYSGADLMEAVLGLQETNAVHRMDERFDGVEGRLTALEPHEHRPAS